MASAFSHAMVAVTVGQAFKSKELRGRELFLGAFCSVIPDLDVIGFSMGIQYEDVWGHRGLTHSFLFAGLLAVSLVALWYRRKSTAVMTGLFLYFFLCAASHGLLDAMTNGGLGIAFFSPLDTTRYFFPVRPVLVSPIGIGDFFSAQGVRILVSEATWIWLPSCVALVVFRGVQRFWPAESNPNT